MAKVFRYFLGANSPQGYISRFDQLGEAGDWRRWVVTGGSAQGRAALIAQAQKRLVPRCAEVEEIRSTGDPKRVEGLILPEHRIAIADGGPPHFLRPQCPGAYERIVSLWECLDQDTLYRAREELLALGEEEKRLWKDARGYLYAAGALAGDLASVGSAAMNRGKVLAYARGAALREFPHPLPGGKRGREQVRFLSALTGEGLDKLGKMVAELFPKEDAVPYGQLLTNARQEETAGRAREAVRRAREALDLWPQAKIVLPEDRFPGQALLSGRRERVRLPELTLGFIRLTHEGPRYADKPHYGCILESRGTRVLITGDCRLCAPELAEFLAEDGPIDLAILDFPWLTLPRGRRFVQEHIRPKMLLVCHLPFSGDDIYGYRAAALKSAPLLEGVDVRLLSEPFQQETLEDA